MKQCPSCGATADEGARFCKNCAFDFSKAPAPQAAGLAETVKANACPNCGVAVAIGAKFCNNCAAPLAGAGASHAQPANAQPAYAQPGYAPRSGPSFLGGPNRKPILIAASVGGVALIGLTILLIVLLSGGGGGGASTPGEAVRSLINAELRGDTNQFISYFTKQDRDAIAAAGPERRKLIENVVQQASKQAKDRGMPTINIKKEDVNGNNANVEFEVKWKDGETEQGSMRLVKEDGSWRVRAQDVQ